MTGAGEGRTQNTRRQGAGDVDDELEDFKTNINLGEYAAAQGYVLDRKASSRNSAVMKHPDGDKIVIARGHDRHWIFFSVHNSTDNGSIIDFVQNRKGVKLGAVRQALRPWTTGMPAHQRPHPDLFAAHIEPVTKDRAQVIAVLARSSPLAWHDWLEQDRNIPRALIQSPRFIGKLKADVRANVLFPHHDQDGPCGYEIKNKGFTGYAKGGDKGLWFSAANRADDTLVIAESGIDALSYACVFPDKNARYASIGGAMNPNQPALIEAAVAKMGQGSRIVLALDNDEGGHELAGQIEALIQDIDREDLVVEWHLPPGEGQDWNDVLRAAGTARTEAPGPTP